MNRFHFSSQQNTSFGLFLKLNVSQKKNKSYNRSLSVSHTHNTIYTISFGIKEDKYGYNFYVIAFFSIKSPQFSRLFDIVILIFQYICLFSGDYHNGNFRNKNQIKFTTKRTLMNYELLFQKKNRFIILILFIFTLVFNFQLTPSPIIQNKMN